jgi:hypothetical protein
VAVNVGGNEKGAESGYVGPRDKKSAAYVDSVVITDLQVLKQGLVGGVKPLAISIPETGKALLLASALPPSRVGVTLEVKVKR